MKVCVNDFFILNGESFESDKFEDLYATQGKCIYEVIRVINGVPLFLKEHLLRLENSLNIENSGSNISMDVIKYNINRLIEVNKILNGNIKLVINNSNIYYFSIPHTYPTRDMYNVGVKTILYFGERNNPNAKVIDNSFRGKVNKEIEASNSYEAILVSHEGYITEGSKSNIFMVKGNEVFTAPVEGVLPGITRGQIIKACSEIGMKVIEKNICYKDIESFNGLFISGTSPKVLPINEVEGIIKYDEISKEIYSIKDQFEKIIEEDLKRYNKTR